MCLWFFSIWIIWQRLFLLSCHHYSLQSSSLDVHEKRMFMTIIIPDPSNPKSKIDVYLQLFTDGLKLLWNEGALTYNMFLRQNFMMRTSLI